MIIYKNLTMDEAIQGLHRVCQKRMKNHHIASEKINQYSYELDIQIIASAHDDELRLAVNNSVTVEDVYNLVLKIGNHYGDPRGYGRDLRG